jgi:hypothetical protein
MVQRARRCRLGSQRRSPRRPELTEAQVKEADQGVVSLSSIQSQTPRPRQVERFVGVSSPQNYDQNPMPEPQQDPLQSHKRRLVGPAALATIVKPVQPVRPKRQALRNERAWGRLPNSVALDQRVTTETLVLLAYRTTLVNFSLAVEGHNALVRGGGLGRDVVLRANAEARRLGLLERQQLGGRPGSKFRHAVEELALPEPGQLGRRIIRQSWFSGALSKRELAALLFLRAAGRVLCRELADRFDWSRTTAKDVLRTLVKRELVVVSTTRTDEGAFGPTFYAARARIPRNLDAPHSGMVNGQGLEADQPRKSHGQSPGPGTPGLEKPGHVLTASQGVPSEHNLATLDYVQPARTSRSEDLSDGHAPPAPFVSERAEASPSAQKREQPGSDAAWTVLRDWRASPFWQGRSFQFTGEVKIEDWNLDWWGTEVENRVPPHLVTPAAFRQVVEIAHELAALTPRDPHPTRHLAALAFWIAKAHYEGKPIRSLGFIAEDLARRCENGDTTWLYDYPSCLQAAEVAQARALAERLVGRLDHAGVDINRPTLLGTYEIDRLVRRAQKSSIGSIEAAIAAVIARGTKPRDGKSIAGWHWFDDHIAAPRQPVPTTEEQRASRKQERTERAAYSAHLRKLVQTWVDRLETEGAGHIEIKRERLLSWEKIDALSRTLIGLGIEPERADAIMHRFVDMAIAQRVTELASWRKGLVELATNPTR